MTCLICGSTNLDTVPALTSEFLSRRAWNGTPEPTKLHRCRGCEFRWFARRLTDTEAARYYVGYRDESYFAERNAAEWFYTPAVHRSLVEGSASDERARAVRLLLMRLGFPAFGTVLDYGGGDSGLLREVMAKRSLVYDLNGKGVGVDDGSCDLVSCAHVLEHVSDPAASMREMVRLLAPGGVLYLELPKQHWRDEFAPSWVRETLLGVAQSSTLAYRTLDTACTALRVKAGWLPPWAFMSEREHINFFSSDAMRRLSVDAGLMVLDAGDAPDLSGTPSMYLVGRKS